MAKLAQVRYEHGLADEAHRLLADAVILVGDEMSPAAAQVHYRSAKIGIRNARIHEALAAAERAIEIAERFGPEPVLIGAMDTKGLCLGVINGVDEGIQLIRRARERALASSLVSQAAQTYRTEMMVIYFHHGRTDQSLDVLRQGMAFARERCGTATRLDLQLDLALGLVEAGNLTEAGPLLDELSNNHRRDVRTLTVQHTAALHAILRGDLAEAGEILLETRKLHDRFSVTERGFQHRLQAEVARRTGDLEQADREIDAAIEQHLDQDNLTFTRESLLEKCRIARAIADIDQPRAAEMTAPIRALIERAMPDSEEMRVLRDLMHLELDLVHGPAPAADVKALARELAESGFGAEAKQTELLHAQLLAAEHPETSELHRVLDELRALGRSSGMLWLCDAADAILPSEATIDLTEVVDVTETGRIRTEAGEDHGLTPREIEVLGMLARGLTNKEIGAELFVSHRTVSTHVSNLLAKLHLKNRSEAAAKFHELGLADLRS